VNQEKLIDKNEIETMKFSVSLRYNIPPKQLDEYGYLELARIYGYLLKEEKIAEEKKDDINE